MKRSHLLTEILLPAWLQRGLGIPRSSLYGEARWMGLREKRRFLSSRHRGLVLGPGRRLSAEESFKNLVLLAPTGAGKTSRYVIPNLLELQGSAVVTDPSGEIYRATSGALAARGYTIQVLQPEAPEGSRRFNPLHYFRGDSELRRLATVLAATTGGGEQDAFWRIGAGNVLRLGLQAVTALPEATDHTLANLRQILNALSAGEQQLDDFMVRTLSSAAFAEYRAFLGQEDKARSGQISTARAALDLWTDEVVLWFTGRNTVDIAQLRERPTVIYLIVSEHKVRYYSVLLNLFYTACFEYCLQSGTGPADEPLPVSFFLDEFGNLGRIDNFPAMITTLRKRRCAVSIILQELAQLESIYGRQDARIIFGGGCANKLFFSGLDLETCLYLESQLGQQTEYDDEPGGGRVERKLGTPLLRHDQIRMLPPQQAVLLSSGRRPLYLKLPPCFRVKAWRRQMQLPPLPHPAGRPEAEAAPALTAEGQPWFLEGAFAR